MPMRLHASLLCLLVAAPAGAQGWNDPSALALVERGVARRRVVAADSTLRSWRTEARGFVFFLAQIGEGFATPPRLVKADELVVEVYWEAPNWSKQRILGWRDGRWLPTDIRYHRDHLGVVTNNYGDWIRIGEGDEVRDVPHPLSPGGQQQYDYALVDSLRIRTGRRDVRVYQVAVRPKDFSRPLVVGTLFLDMETAEVVRFRFGFTPSAYLDGELEDISIVLENALYEGSYWLPARQEIEIRRRTAFLDFPARGIIRGRWEVGDYDLQVAVPEAVRVGPAIGGLRAASDTAYPWSEPLQAAIGDLVRPLGAQDMETLRAEVERIAAGRALRALPRTRLAIGSVSDLARVNRVQGLALGLGLTLGGRRSARPWVGYGTSDERLVGGLTLAAEDAGPGATALRLRLERRIRDLSDERIISPLLNSILAQEAGQDHGDYVLLDEAALTLRQGLTPSGRHVLSIEAGIERTRSVAVAATPAGGTYRDNPPLGAGELRRIRLGLERTAGDVRGGEPGFGGTLLLEAGDGAAATYGRAALGAAAAIPLAHGTLAAAARLGMGTAELPAHRSFVLGGRGTLPGEPFRAYGGRGAALVHLEWRLEAPAPAIPLGPYATTGRTMILAPFVAAGWTGRAIPDLPWRETGGVRPVAGFALEWFMRLLRLELGVGLRDGGIGIAVDVGRDWWEVL